MGSVCPSNSSSMKLAELSAQNQFLKSEVEKYKTNLLQMKAELQKKTMQNTTSTQMTNTRYINDQMRELISKNQGSDVELGRKKVQIQELQHKLNKVEGELLKKQQTIISLQSEITNNIKQVKQKQRKIENNQRQIQQLRRQPIPIIANRSNHVLKGDSNSEMGERLPLKNNGQEQNLQEIVRELKMSIALEKQKNDKLLKELSEMRKIMLEAQKISEKKIQQLTVLRAYNEESSSKQKSESEQEKKKLKDGYEQRIALLQKENQKLKQEADRQSDRIKDLIREIEVRAQKARTSLKAVQTEQLQKRYSEQRIRLSSGRNYRPIDGLFYGQVLDDQYEMKRFLVDTLERHTNKKILKTKMLFKIDELNRTNFHKYIDNEDNFVLVVKINSGQYVAAYSEGALIPKKNSSKDGLIISLTNQKYFTLCVPNSRATVYDDFYLIFGCAEIRIRLNELKIFSNFGMINVAYNTRGETVNTLLGAGGVREVPMENYEIHKIIFRE